MTKELEMIDQHYASFKEEAESFYKENEQSIEYHVKNELTTPSKCDFNINNF